jgi:hypothetical protein
MDLKEVGWEGVNWIDVDENSDWRQAFLNMVLQLQAQ